MTDLNTQVEELADETPSASSNRGGGGLFSSIFTSVKTFLNEERDALKREEERQREKNRQLQSVATDLVTLPPWDGLDTEDAALAADVKQELLALPRVRNTFLVGPTEGDEDFEFDYERYLECAQAALRADEQLREARFYFVPRKLKEHVFWCNYFRTVHVVKRQYGLSSEPLAVARDDPRAASYVQLLDAERDAKNSGKAARAKKAVLGSGVTLVQAVQAAAAGETIPSPSPSTPPPSRPAAAAAAAAPSTPPQTATPDEKKTPQKEEEEEEEEEDEDDFVLHGAPLVEQAPSTYEVDQSLEAELQEELQLTSLTEKMTEEADWEKELEKELGLK